MCIGTGVTFLISGTTELGFLLTSTWSYSTCKNYLDLGRRVCFACMDGFNACSLASCVLTRVPPGHMWNQI